MKKTALDKWICDKENLPYLSREVLNNLKLNKLNELLSREHKRGGFYSHLPEYIENLDDLESLPFTTPEDLADNAGRMLLASQSEVDRVISGVTSGTTGPSKRVFYSAGDLENTISFFSAGISEMTEEGEKVLITMPFAVSGGLGELIAKAVESLGAIPIRAGSNLSYGELEEIMRYERPSAYIGMPIPLLSLLRYCGDRSTLGKALVSADICSPSVCSEIEKLIGSKLFPHYGLRESCMGGAVTCQAHEGMHIRENHIIPEIIDGEGRRVHDGEYGELVITTIGMELMPLIRYRTGDRARILPSPCPCGGVSTRIEVEGRLEENLRMSDIDDAVFGIDELVDLKVKKEGDGLEITAYLLTDKDISEEIRSRISPLISGENLNIITKACEPEHKNLYSGKRVIEDIEL